MVEALAVIVILAGREHSSDLRPDVLRPFFRQLAQVDLFVTDPNALDLHNFSSDRGDRLGG